MPSMIILAKTVEGTFPLRINSGETLKVYQPQWWHGYFADTVSDAELEKLTTDTLKEMMDIVKIKLYAGTGGKGKILKADMVRELQKKWTDFFHDPEPEAEDEEEEKDEEEEEEAEIAALKASITK